MNQVTRKLPSADWIAVGLAVAGLVLSRFQTPFVGLFALAVFGPSLLRELGWLKDGDEFTRVIMYRAAFHALLVVATVIFLNKMLQFWPGVDTAISSGEQWAFPMEEIRKILVLVFLFSYLIQYWGSRQGVFRIMLGMALLTVIEVVVFALHWKSGNAQPWYFPVVGGIVLVLVALAFAVRRWPFAMGIVLCVLAVVALADSVRNYFTVPSQNAYVFLSIAIQALVFFGVTGVSLVMSGREVEE